MFRNRFLGGVSFLPLMDKENEGGSEKTAEQLRNDEREKIDVTVSQSGGDDKENDNNNDANKDDDSEEKEEDEEGEEKEDDEDGEDATAKDGETEEQRKERVAKEKEDRKQARINKRIGRYKSERDELADKVAKLEAQLAEKPGDEKLTEEEVERRAEEKADLKLREKQAKDAEAKFENDQIKLSKQATKADKEFGDKVVEMAEECGAIPASMIGILANELDHDNGGDVLAYLAQEDNRDEYAEIIGLPLIKMTKRLDKISAKLHEEKTKKAPKKDGKVSQAPPPITPVNEGGGRGVVTTLTGKEDTETFVRIRNEQVAARRKAQGYR